MNWYYATVGKQAGPVTEEQFTELARTGVITDDTLVWREGMANWEPYRTIKPPPAAATEQPASAVPPSGTRPTCSRCGRSYYYGGVLNPGEAAICPSCLQEPGASPASGAGLEYVGFWIRFAAKLLDGLLVGIVIGIPMCIVAALVAFGASTTGTNSGPAAPEIAVIADVVGLIAQLAMAVVQVGYSTFFLGKYGATPGKMICQIKVVDATGAPIGYGRAFGRSCAEILSGMICLIGYIIAAFDGEKRALHDHMCSTRVVHKHKA